MSIRFTPLHIQLLLHCYMSSETYEPWSGAILSRLHELEGAGAVLPDGESPTTFETTDLGDAWVLAICNMPPPRVAYLDAQGKEIEPWPLNSSEPVSG